MCARSVRICRSYVVAPGRANLRRRANSARQFCTYSIEATGYSAGSAPAYARKVTVAMPEICRRENGAGQRGSRNGMPRLPPRFALASLPKRPRRRPPHAPARYAVCRFRARRQQANGLRRKAAARAAARFAAMREYAIVVQFAAIFRASRLFESGVVRRRCWQCNAPPSMPVASQERTHTTSPVPDISDIAVFTAIRRAE